MNPKQIATWLVLVTIGGGLVSGCEGGCQCMKRAGTGIGARVEPLKQEAHEATTRARQGADAIKSAAGKLKAPERVASARNLKRIAAALLRYHDAHGQFPPVAHRAPDGTPLLSWRVLVLPYLGPEEAALFKEFDLSEPWDGPHNARLLARMPPVYAPPGGKPARIDAPPGAAAAALTFYKGVTGPGAVFDPGQTVSLKDVTDGPARTLMVIEAGEPVPWSKPEDLVFHREQPLPRLGFFGGHFLAVYCNGSLQGFVEPEILHEDTLHAAATINGGEPVEPLGGSSDGGGWDFD